MNDNNNNTIDDIISMLDSFTSNDGGHINVFVNNDNIQEKFVEKANTLDCSLGNMACNVPTLFNGVDDLHNS